MFASLPSFPLVFDRAAVRRRRERAAARFHRYDFLKRELAARLVERLEDTTPTYARILDLGSHTGHVAAALQGRRQAGTVVSADLAAAMAACAAAPRLVCDEEALPFAPCSFDLVTSCFSLHWVNDLPGTLAQIRGILKPGGLFLAALPGGETLLELRLCLQDAELSLEGGASPRLSPLADIRDLGMLLQRAGFVLPTVDRDVVAVSYRSALSLMRELQGMGESNAVALRRKTFSRRSTLFEAARLYRDRFSGTDGRLPATFHILWLAAWSPPIAASASMGNDGSAPQDHSTS